MEGAHEMKAIYRKMWELAKPYLDTRENDTHTQISLEFAQQLLKTEGGDEDIVIPAIILHDVGWKKVPEELHLKAFGPKSDPELTRIHEVEGEKIAREILEQLRYDQNKTHEILRIIEAHDTRKEAISLNDRLVKDADALYRVTREAFPVNIARFGETFDEEMDRVKSGSATWFVTPSAKNIAARELKNRLKESKSKSA
jgi:HD superfamily phosphodiesterase